MEIKRKVIFDRKEKKNGGLKVIAFHGNLFISIKLATNLRK